MKKFYQKYPLVVILTSIITTIIIGIVVLSALLLPKLKSSKQENYSKVAVETKESGSRLQVISGLTSGDKIIEEAAAYVDTP